MSAPEISPNASVDTLAERNRKFDQLTGILRKKISWNQKFMDISTMELKLHARVNNFRQIQEDYLTIKDDLLDGILSKEIKLDFSLVQEIDAKYQTLNETANQFKIKLSTASEEVKKDRKVWLDDGFVPDLTTFLKVSEKSRKAVINKCRQGDWVAEKVKLKFQDMTFEWSKLEEDLEDGVKDCTRRVENLLWEKLVFSGVKSCSRMSDAWKERVIKNLRKRALQTMTEKSEGTLSGECSTASSETDTSCCHQKKNLNH